MSFGCASDFNVASSWTQNVKSDKKIVQWKHRSTSSIAVPRKNRHRQTGFSCRRTIHLELYRTAFDMLTISTVAYQTTFKDYTFLYCLSTSSGSIGPICWPCRPNASVLELGRCRFLESVSVFGFFFGFEKFRFGFRFRFFGKPRFRFRFRFFSS